jgi:hypothetical protein
MSRKSLASALTQIVLLILLANISPIGSFLWSTCTGSDPCYACKNCKYCRHCAKEGGKCGICK